MQRSSQRYDVYRRFFERFQRSGVSVRESCAKEALSTKTFYYRRKRIAAIASTNKIPACTSTLKLLPVAVQPLPDEHGVYEIRFPDATRLILPARFDPIAAAVLIKNCRPSE